MPLVSYFDDMGARPHSEIDQLTMDTVKIFMITFGVFLNKDKAKLGNEMTFLGLLGNFAGPAKAMALEIA